MKKSRKVLKLYIYTGNLKEKEERGITLVVLVITIIILLILAAITIGQLTKGGLFDKAKQARQETIKKEAEEEMELIVLEVRTENEGQATLKDIVKKLEEKPEKYIVRTESKYAKLTSSGNDSDIISINSLDGTEKELYVTNTQYDVEIKITANMQIEVGQEKGSDSQELTIDELKEQLKQKNQEITTLNNRIALLESEIDNQGYSLELLKVGQYRSSAKVDVDIKEVFENYELLTIDNFVIKNPEPEAYATWNGTYYGVSGGPLIKSYDPVKGVLSLGSFMRRDIYNNAYGFSYLSYDVYIVY